MGNPIVIYGCEEGIEFEFEKKWRHLEPLRPSGGALGGARAPVTQKTIALSIPATQRAVENVSGQFGVSQDSKT